MAASLQHLLITMKDVALEEVSFSDTKILMVFVNTLKVDEKHYLLNRDNLRQPIQTELSRKRKKVF